MRIAVLTGAIALSGCAVGPEEDARTVTVQSPASTTTPGAPAEPSSPTGGAPPSPEGALVEQEASVDDGRARFVVTELKRSGPTVVLTARLDLVQGDSLQVADTFNDGQFQDLANSDAPEGGDVLDGLALIDPKGRKKYLVARDSEGRCVCSNSLSSAFVGEGTPVDLQATLSAPPPDVRRVNLQVPGVRTFTDVPLAG